MHEHDVHHLVAAVAAIDESCRDREAITTAATHLQRLRSWCDSREALFARLLEQTSSTPEHDYAAATRTSHRHANRALERANTADALPGFADALASGAVSGEHLDVMGRALRALEPAQRAELLAHADTLQAAAEHATPAEFERRVRAEVARLHQAAGDDGDARLERQRRAARLRTWIDRDSGMWHLAGQFDPATGVLLSNRLDTMTTTLFTDREPDGCPTDPLEKQQFLRAQALVALTEGTSPAASEPEAIVVIDASQPDPAGGPSVDWGLPVEVPLSVLRALFPRTCAHAVVIGNGVVLHAPGQLDLGRSTRIANRAQRRALRALYATCAIPGCEVRYRHCKIHHIHWWRHGGPTDLANLLPLCPRHHHCVHDKSWTLDLGLNRHLTIHLPDGRTLTATPNRRQRAA